MNIAFQEVAMAHMNVEPMTTFSDGSTLLVSTRYIGDANFRCELYVSSVGQHTDQSTQSTLHLACAYRFEAPTCFLAQEQAYTYAMRMYPQAGGEMKKPPYLIWSGPLNTVHA
jgi:hypothetical protein